MTANPRTFEYILAGVDNLVGRGHFHNGAGFRPTQGDALSAYHEYLHSDELTPEEKLKGFFEIPTGVGKTAVFLAILDEAHRVARANSDKLRAMIVVPTIAIMTQMKEGEQPGEKGEVEEWAPDFMGKVGFYGGDYREFGEELTIITYDSWTALMEAGEIDSSNVDILVSDEAHRGTSERRITNIFNAFANGTLQVAFTATASFDEDKSVEQSHGRKIFGRGVADSVRLDELAAYIQVQLYMIRLQPPKLTDEFEEVRETEAERLGKKQDAWMRQMVEVMRNGRDLHTNDLLTDNKSGFYVRGTEMADRMARLANADPILQERARVQGKLGVMVSIHSKMHPDEQKARMRAFKRGDYLAAASDTQLKEGFNDKTLKNVFDYPRGSLVDKAQIIGRAARKWFNEAKQRFEGATIIDTIVYEGSDDPEQDERNKNHAIRYAIMAWSVLDGTAVFTPKFEEDERPGYGGGGGGGVSPVYGLDVTSYTELEDVQAIYAYQRKLIEGNKIPLTNSMRNALRKKLDDSYISIETLIKSIENLPETLNASKVSTWLAREEVSKIKNVDTDEWNLVFDAAQKFEDSQYTRLTKDMRTQLKDIIFKLRGKEKAAIQLIKQAGLNHCVRSIKSWSDDNSSIYKVLKKDWNAVIQALSSKEKVPLTEDMRIALKQEIIRVGLGAVSIAKMLNDENITESKIKAWTSLKNDTKMVVKIEWDNLINFVKELPDAEPKEIVHITDDLRGKLNFLMDQKGIKHKSLLEMIASENIDSKKITQWKTGVVKTISKEVWDAMMDVLNNHPDKKPKGPAPSP